MLKTFINKSSKGFTLIEILIATSILVMVGVAAILVEKQFMGSGSTNKHKLQATGLAQEGINAVRAAFNTQLLKNGTVDPGTYIVNADGNIISGQTQTIPLNGVDFVRTITVQ